MTIHKLEKKTGQWNMRSEHRNCTKKRNIYGNRVWKDEIDKQF